jgi:hypothetical protein
MIHYQLRCSHDHEFDGWFNDSASFDRQAKRGLVECPNCGDSKVVRALMAPAVSTREAAPPPASAPPQPVAPAMPPPVPAMAGGGRMPAHLVAMLQKMRAEVERNCDYVGPELAEEARKIHRGDAEERGIYGEATPDEAEALAEEGIELRQIPWVPRADG